MNSIIIDTTADKLLLIVIKGNEVYTFLSGEAKRHTATVLVELDKLLKTANICIRDVQNIGVIVGPGSFTGIRIGVATANALSFALGANLVEITSLEPILLNQTNALSLLGCNHGNYYALLKNGTDEQYFSLNETDLKNYLVPLFFVNSPSIDKIVECFNLKLKNKIFVPVAKPFYIKQSSAVSKF
jgi:tRNA threonylcarbamoyl adenosine modification protein YeaZ